MIGISRTDNESERMSVRKEHLPKICEWVGVVVEGITQETVS